MVFLFLHTVEPSIDKNFIDASKNGDLEHLIYFLKIGADVHARNNEAFVSAVDKGHIEVARYL